MSTIVKVERERRKFEGEREGGEKGQGGERGRGKGGGRGR